MKKAALYGETLVGQIQKQTGGGCLSHQAQSLLLFMLHVDIYLLPSPHPAEHSGISLDCPEVTDWPALTEAVTVRPQQQI